MREYFCTKLFCSFVYKITAQACAALCCICVRQINGNANFRNEFCNCTAGDVINVSLIERPVAPLLYIRRQYDVIILFKFRMLINVLIF